MMWCLLYSSLLFLLASDSLVFAYQNVLDFGEIREEESVKYLRYPFPDLPYAYDGLEPLMDERTLRAHHGLHHRAYTNKMNAALLAWSSEVLYNFTCTCALWAWSSLTAKKKCN